MDRQELFASFPQEPILQVRFTHEIRTDETHLEELHEMLKEKALGLICNYEGSWVYVLSITSHGPIIDEEGRIFGDGPKVEIKGYVWPHRYEPTGKEMILLEQYP